MKSSPPELCEYLGRIGVAQSNLADHLEEEPGFDEIECWKKGVKARKLEIRAIELELVKRGGKVEDWMKR